MHLYIIYARASLVYVLYGRSYNNFFFIVSQISQLVRLAVLKYRSLYFILRAVNEAGVTSLVSTELELHDLQPISGLEVLDIALDNDIGHLHEYLHASNLGNYTRLLHNMDVDFTDVTDGITGAVTGVECDQYSWWLQLDADTNCFDATTDNALCVKAKASLQNSVKFTRVTLTPGEKYYVCVRTEGQCPLLRSCSNGFVVDTYYPQAGTVETGKTLHLVCIINLISC